MMNEISLRETDSWADVMPAVGDLASKISTTNFVPKGLRGKPAEIAACILTGREVGIGPMQSLSKIHVIDGKPAMSSELMRSLVMAAGHEITYPTLSDEKVIVKGRRANSDQWTEVTWTIKDAQRIGVAGRDTWKKYPRQMLSARATSELCRLLFPDALGGISYTVEELKDDNNDASTKTPVRRARVSKVNQAPEPVEPPLEPENPAQGDLGASGTESSDPDADIVDAEIIEDTPEDPLGDTTLVSEVIMPGGITGPQIKMMGAQMRTLNMDRQAALDFCQEHTGRDIESRNDLTKTEATLIIDALASLVKIAAPNE
jgi:hypothetical protein